PTSPDRCTPRRAPPDLSTLSLRDALPISRFALRGPRRAQRARARRLKGRMSGSVEPGSGQRIDRWLWLARFLKSRTLAAALVASGKMRVNGERVVKASRLVRPGDVLTFPLGPHIRVIEVVASGTRRGPADEARGLYADLAPPAPPAATET